jgi:hypothetical protein
LFLGGDGAIFLPLQVASSFTTEREPLQVNILPFTTLVLRPPALVLVLVILFTTVVSAKSTVDEVIRKTKRIDFIAKL